MNDATLQAHDFVHACELQQQPGKNSPRRTDTLGKWKAYYYVPFKATLLYSHLTKKFHRPRRESEVTTGRQDPVIRCLW